MQTTGINNQQNSFSLTPESLPTDQLKGSIDQVVESLTGKNVDATTLNELKLSEDVLYASVVLNRVESKFPGQGAKLLEAVKNEYQKNVASSKRQPLTIAVNHFLHSLVKGKKITNNSKEALMRYAFGKSQLDNKKSTLARAPENPTNAQAPATGKTMLDQALDRVTNNKGASKRELANFKHRLSKNRRLTKAQAQEQANVLERMFPAAKPTTAPPVTSSQKPSTPSEVKPQESDKPGAIPDKNSVVTGPDDFVYKPSSERDGKMLFMIPQSWRDRAMSAILFDVRGENELKKLNPPTYGDDGRIYFRGDQNGKELKGPGLLKVSLTDGSTVDWMVGDLADWQFGLKN